MKKISLLLSLLLIGTFSRNSFAKKKPLVLNLIHTISEEPPGTIDRELVPNIEKLARKTIKKFGKKLQKTKNIRILDNAHQKKLIFANGILTINNIHAQYTHQNDDYNGFVTLTAIIQTPDNHEFFKKDYSYTGKLHLSNQWSQWIAINKIIRFTLDKILNSILSDPDFSNALPTIDTTSFFKKNSPSAPTAPQERVPKNLDSIEERIKALNSLKEKGLITEEEYNTKKKALIDEL